MNLKSYKINLVFFVFSLLVVSSFMLIEVIYFANENKKIALEDTLDVAKRREASIINFLKNSDELLHSIEKSRSFATYLNLQNNSLQLEDLFLTIVNTQPNIMQLRYIDINGNEKIRVDRTKEETVRLITKDNLQNKSDRYYFKDSIEKPLNQVWYSDLDLNVENKKVETPYTPTLRAMLPVKKDEDFKGIIIVNYYMENFLADFFKNSIYDMVLLNTNGDIIKHYNNKKDWSFYKNEKEVLAREYSKYSKDILAKDIFKNDDYVSVKFNTPLENDLILVLHLKKEYLMSTLKEHIYQKLILGFIVIVLFLLLNRVIAKIVKKVLLDLNKTKELNNKLQKLSNSLNEAQQVAKIGFWELNTQTNELFWSEGVYDILYIKDKTLKPSYELLLSFVHEDDREKLNYEYQESIQQKREYYIVHRVQTNHNQLRYVQERATHYYDEEGVHIRSVGSIYDKTDAILTEKKIKDYVELIDNNIITSSTDLYGNLISVSNAFCEISGYTRGELIGSNHRIVRHPDTNNDIFENLWRTIHNDMVWSGELKNIKKDGGFYWVNANIYPTYNELGNKIGYTAVRQDITNQKLLEELSITDGLTGIYNRRYFNDLFPKYIKSATRKNELISLLIMDIDYFKQYNDTYGHQMGDHVLKQVAAVMKLTLQRADDYCFRLGGEEFGVIFKTETADDALVFANKIKDKIESLKIIHEKNTASSYITVSMGLLCKNANDIISEDSIYRAADELLYNAKDAGRNQVDSNII